MNVGQALLTGLIVVVLHGAAIYCVYRAIKHRIVTRLKDMRGSK